MRRLSCHDQKIYKLHDVAILTVTEIDYRIYFCGKNKSEALNEMENAKLQENVDN